MNREIKYSGYTAVPSDYESPDGQLSLSLNLLLEGKGSVRSVLPPKSIRSFNPGFDPTYLHKTAIGVNCLIVIVRDSTLNTTGLYFCDFDNPSSELKLFGNLSVQLLQFSAIGNTLLALTSEGIHYFLFKDNSYVALGLRPPFVSISFSMVMEGMLSASESSEFPNCPRWTRQQFNGNTGGNAVVYSKTDEDDAFLNSLSTPVMGLLLSEVAENVTSKGKFYQPFFVRYAFRLFDGSYVWHSAPILMLPAVCVPPIQLSDVSTDKETLSFKSTLHVPYFSLAKRILRNGLGSLFQWEDIVTSVDVFISAPIYTYSQSEGVKGWARLSDIYARNGMAFGHRTDRPEYAFLGHYAASLASDPKDFTAKLSDYDSSRGWCLVPNEKFEDSIKDCSLFYLYKSIPLNEIAYDEKPSVLKPDTEDLSNLVARPRLDDDYQSHFRLKPSFATVYNSRVHLCGMTLGLPDPFPIASAVTPSGSLAQQGNVSVRVWSKRGGMRSSVLSVSHADADLFPLVYELPRYIFYPDSSAYMMMLQCGNRTVVFNLKEHPTLNGAYWFAGLDAVPQLKTVLPDSVALPDSVPALSKVYVSDATNPMIFPASGIVTVGSGSVFALASAAKALSQGQFGQFPLYAFTSEGVWALEVGSSGSYAARQPITRDVCTTPGSITQIDSAVLFATDRGIMLISGSQTSCISTVIDSDNPFRPLSLPGMDAFRELLAVGDDACLDIKPFSVFLSNCGMVYDYVHQRIYVFSPIHSYAYVYSLESKMWGMVRSKISHAINSYPESLAVDSGGNLVSFSQVDDSKFSTLNSQLLITRPLKLGAPDILKTISSMIQRGHFAGGHVRCALYGSRDLFSWHLIRSSQDHFLRAFRGSPYKYFRIVLLCNLGQDESLSGCSVEFMPRFTNRLR